MYLLADAIKHLLCSVTRRVCLTQREAESSENVLAKAIEDAQLQFAEQTKGASKNG